MKVKVSEASGEVLDWMVAKASGMEVCVIRNPAWSVPVYIATNETGLYTFDPSTNWAQGGPIIERGKINPEWMPHSECWMANCVADRAPYEGPTPLIAAMRCYVASKLGEEVDVPEELK